ncbi:hypothetical protein QTQ03_28375 [Micromonospora sp. WMMA1363]|uniref:hypothetical protein n=1 Tax=Micromonospora sp. WMMA1363 TaxID=3053985 RepID=UPI00259C708F|nr:hypothetical protein [Micromonospora sp. WMMA1363]MDM4723324.1 hypothetical protein [Micromonospora sp. WMMA1363]
MKHAALATTAALVLLVGAVLLVVQPASTAADATTCLTPEGRTWTLDAEQQAHAQLIVDIGRQRAVPARGWAVAIATAAQESSLRNVTEPDPHGSSGLFQQTPPWWGTRLQVNDPTYATSRFYEALTHVTGWQTMPLTVAAQAVQNSAYPDHYRQHTATAITVIRDLTGVELDCARITTTGADPAPRNPDGSWPTEACTIAPDPTTGSGCITPRLAHLVTQTTAAGYPDPGCYRPGHRGEHPKGRACDWMMTAGGDATGSQRQTGDAFATWAVANADRLGIMYVIWYRRIWTRADGWHPYNNPWGGNNPSGWHTNHIHISVY